MYIVKTADITDTELHNGMDILLKFIGLWILVFTIQIAIYFLDKKKNNEKQN